jgi:hypothetical protein
MKKPEPDLWNLVDGRSGLWPSLPVQCKYDVEFEPELQEAGIS